MSILPIKLDPKKIRERLLKQAENYTPPHIFEPWEDDIIREFDSKVPARVIAEQLGATATQILTRRQQLGLGRPHNKGHMHPKDNQKRH